MSREPGRVVLGAVLGMALIAGAGAVLGHASSTKRPVVPPPTTSTTTITPPTTTTTPTTRTNPAVLSPLVTYPTGHGASVPMPPGQIVSFNEMYVRNRSDRPVVLDRILQFRTKNGGPDIVGVYAIAPWRHTAWPGYRVPATGRALPGAIVQPHQKLALVIGVRATRGRHSFESVDVLYHSSAGSFRLRVPFALEICSPGTVGRCPIPKFPDEVGG